MAAEYITTNIRNIALMGHGGEGKTTLTEAMLYAAGIIDRQGKVEEGNTTTDFEAEEIKRGCSLSAATAPIDWNDKMLNVIDVPGYFDFIGASQDHVRDKKWQVLDYALNSVGCLDRGRALMIGDRKYDAEGAKLCGIDSMGVLWGHGSAEELSAAGFEYIVKTPEDARRAILENK